MAIKIILTDDNDEQIIGTALVETAELEKQQEAQKQEVKEIFNEEFKKFFPKKNNQNQKNKKWLWDRLLEKWDKEDINEKDIQNIIRQGYIGSERAEFEWMLYLKSLII